MLRYSKTLPNFLLLLGTRKSFYFHPTPKCKELYEGVQPSFLDATWSPPDSPRKENIAFSALRSPIPFCCVLPQVLNCETETKYKPHSSGGTLLPLWVSSQAQVTVIYGEVRGTEDMSLHLLLWCSSQFFVSWLWLGFWIQRSVFDYFVICIILWISNRLAAAVIGRWQDYYSKVLSHYSFMIFGQT